MVMQPADRSPVRRLHRQAPLGGRFGISYLFLDLELRKRGGLESKHLDAVDGDA